jgi:hypothetical protein
MKQLDLTPAFEAHERIINRMVSPVIFTALYTAWAAGIWFAMSIYTVFPGKAPIIHGLGILLTLVGLVLVLVMMKKAKEGN